MKPFRMSIMISIEIIFHLARPEKRTKPKIIIYVSTSAHFIFARLEGKKNPLEMRENSICFLHQLRFGFVVTSTLYNKNAHPFVLIGLEQ